MAKIARENTVRYDPTRPEDLIRAIHKITARDWTAFAVQKGQPIEVRWHGEQGEDLIPPIEHDLSSLFTADTFRLHDQEPMRIPPPAVSQALEGLCTVADLFRAFVVISAKKLVPAYVLVPEAAPNEFKAMFGLPRTLGVDGLFGATILPCADVQPGSVVVLGVPTRGSDSLDARFGVRVTRTL